MYGNSTYDCNPGFFSAALVGNAVMNEKENRMGSRICRSSWKTDDIRRSLTIMEGFSVNYEF
jgi:hypothetical protein